jgi:hypothetical protein
MKRKTIVQLVCVSASLAALLWLLGRIGWGTIGHALGKVGWKGLTALMVLGWIESFTDGTALWVVMGQRLRYGFGISVNAAGSMLNLILPWESGEVLKGTLLRGQFGTPSAVSGTILWNYIFKISRPAVSLTAALCAWVFSSGTDGFHMGIILTANLLSFLPYLVLRVLVRYGAAAGLVRVLGILPALRRHSGHWIESARTIDHEVKQFWHERPTDYLKVFGLQLVARATGWASIYVALNALGMECSFGQASLLYATVNVTDYIVAVLPARVGVSEGTSYFIFKFLGLDPATGVIMYVVLRIRTILANGLLTPAAFFSWEAPAERTQRTHEDAEPGE